MGARHIAVLQSIAHLGGAEISLLELIRRLRGNPRFTVVLPEDGPLRHRLEQAGATTRILPWPEQLVAFGERASLSGLHAAFAAASVVPRLCRELGRLLGEIGADCVVTNGIKSHLLGAATRRTTRLPVVWYLRDGLEGRRLSAVLLRLYASRCSGAIAISRYVRDESRRILRGLPIEVVYNIVDFDCYRPGIPLPADVEKTNGEVWYGVVGAVTPLKGQDLFIAACRNVLKAVPSARFLLVGGNFYRTERRLQFGAQLRAMVQAAGLQDRVAFLGQRDDAPALLSNLDILVQPNRGPEGLGRSVLEAMACGVPVIAVNRWGPAELVRDGCTGLLTPWMDVDALSERMIKLGRDVVLRQRLGDNARHWVRLHFNPDDLVGRFRQVIEEMITVKKKIHRAQNFLAPRHQAAKKE